ncbi:VOC family protein [Haladaptatus pallidirubidus]|uniref:VOC family protein n=1 Tax=Haladaptatus pallidirubidus TaxID=1008152 RepID=A0AAV3UQK3_9EURY|nr:VOC family protein [Haladaptatus pallidirubidus]
MAVYSLRGRSSIIEATIAFYRDVLDMSFVLKQPNLDAPNVTHLFFDTGDGQMLTFFVEEGRESNTERLRTPIGGIHHLVFRYEPEHLEEVRTGLEEHSHHYNEFDRGIFHSRYTSDHNGLVIELATDKFEIPDDRRGEALALTQQKRLQAGAEYAKPEHLKAALEELGLPIERRSLPEAQSSTGGLE